MSQYKGYNASRGMTVPTVSYGDEIESARTEIAGRTFERAVVVRVFNEPTQPADAFTEAYETGSDIIEAVSNPNRYRNLPRNAIVVRVISGKADLSGDQPVIAYPFLPSHICMPVKTGEQVWILNENPDAPDSSLKYWMWKIHEPNDVEDVNYTHGDRKNNLDSSLSTLEQLEAGNTETKPGFPNGVDNTSVNTLKGDTAYEEIIAGDPAYSNLTLEPVPRFTKRPGDLVLQGSNNSLICLGEDRNGPAQKDEIKTESGAIDLVVGRGRPTSPTAPLVIENTRQYLETDKNPRLNGRSDNLSEGDVDFKTDSARVYLSMKSNVDDDFNLSYPDAFEGSIDNATDAASSVIKSDEVRIIARKDDDQSINGSVRIVKEGDEGTDRAQILLLSDGTAHIDAEVIYIGRVGGNGPGPQGSEPYIKFSKYKEHLSTFIGIVRDVYTTFSTQYAVPVASPGTPHPGLTASIPDLAAKIAELTALELALDQAKSDRIFGE